jgi:hypothetical protein
MKAYLIGIVDRKALSPGGSYRPNDDIIPTLIRRSRVLESPSMTMENQAPEVVRIKTAPHKPQAFKCRQAVSIHIKVNDGWQRSRRSLR